ncbi:hypothetical protein ACGGZK_10950 [Agromyces sp. MMS24-K17]|uniref:hypothetical protein n=1 Tax=Agromyces sp. MMS24-K17 TaxID=3372850 RepID=UPI0037546C5E
MPTRTLLLRASAVTLGGALLTGVAGMAAADEIDGNGVAVQVEIAEIDEPGVLALTVAGDAVTLTEDGSTATVRQFTGTLPEVTVTDTRDADEIPAGAGWYVIGSATNFVGDAGQPTVESSFLGWSPHLDDPDGTGVVAEGPEVFSEIDADGAPNNVGLVGKELLALALDSGEAAVTGSWSATADLKLRVPATVEAGGYTSILTLSLFE